MKPEEVKPEWTQFYELKHHPMASVFPMMSEGELQTLAADIKKNGQQNVIVLFEQMILDGR